MVETHSSGPPWSRQDLLFLENSLRLGRSFAEVAGFLRRDENEVREKAKELKLTDLQPLTGRKLGDDDE
jgi:hypothetical protein